jgi:lipopolysaccharide transport system ATP-binding protein
MAVIEFEHISKSYQLGANRSSLREALSYTTRRLFRSKTNFQKDQLFWALKDVSFKVEQGDVLGIIGKNGAAQLLSCCRK